MAFTSIPRPRAVVLVGFILLIGIGQPSWALAASSRQECDVPSIISLLESDPSLMYTDLEISQDCAQAVFDAISAVEISTTQGAMAVPDSLQATASACNWKTHTVTRTTLGLKNYSVNVQKYWCWNSNGTIYGPFNKAVWTTQHSLAWSQESLTLIAHRWWRTSHVHQTWVQAKMRGEGFAGTIVYQQQDASMCAKANGSYSTKNDCR